MAAPVGGLLYLPVAVWAGTGLALLVALPRSAPALALRLAATFLALWALLATTALIWVLSNGGWTAVLLLVRSPLAIFEPRSLLLWLEGGLAAFVLYLIAFTLNQLVGRAYLHFLRPERLPWPSALPVPHDRVSLLAYSDDRLEAFSFTLLDFPDGRWGRPHRRECIVLSDGLRRRLTGSELEAVIAHELGHVRGLDSRYLTFLRTLARMARWDPLFAYLTSSLTRRAEYRADLEAVRLTRRPLALARALFKANLLSTPRSHAPFPSFLGANGRYRRRDTLERIQRLLALAASGEFPRE